jgi:signal transduction histidine kinase
VLGRLVDELIDTARILTGTLSVERRPVDLAAVVAQAVEAQRPAARDKSVHLHVELAVAPSVCAGDPARLHQLVGVLLANTVKFTPSGGRIAARLDGDAHHLRVEVSDSGRGISAELLPHVFEVFRRGGDQPADLGLGLEPPSRSGCRARADVAVWIRALWSRAGARAIVRA